MKRMPLRLVVVAVVAAVAAGLGSAVYALDDQSGSVPTYTGCLNTSGGTVYNLAEGASPTKACNGNQPQITLSGGDITGVTAVSPLTGGGTEGTVSIGLDPSAVAAGLPLGFGLKLEGSGADTKVSVDPTQIQRRVATGCSSGAISKIDESGDVTCLQTGPAATFDAGTLEAEGSHDTDLCNPFSGDGKSEQTTVSADVTLPPGIYLPVPHPSAPLHLGFFWHIRKVSDAVGDSDASYRGRAWGFVKDDAGNTVSQFIRDFSSAGDNNNEDQDWSSFVGAGHYHLELFAGADACSIVEIGGPLDLVRIG